jgi:ribonuclease G
LLAQSPSLVTIEIIVNVAPRETRAAIIESDVLQEVYLERASRRGLVSNVYKGRVSRVLPGMQAAFVEIGLERTAFLHAADIANVPSEDTVVHAAPLNLSPVEDIRRLVNPGDDILVQGRTPHDFRRVALPLSGFHASRRRHRCLGTH